MQIIEFESEGTQANPYGLISGNDSMHSLYLDPNPLETMRDSHEYRGIEASKITSRSMAPTCHLQRLDPGLMKQSSVYQ